MSRLRGKPVESVLEADLLSLLENGVAESRELEYKAALPANSDADKKEFLADVTAFANSGGGVIVYGVSTGKDATGADTGIPAEIHGLPGINPDQEKLRILGMLQDGVSPALAGLVTIGLVGLAGSGAIVFILGIPRSLAAPHMVSFQRSNRFWRRSESNKYLPDVSEIRRMFLESRSWAAEAEEFRKDRVHRVRRQEVIPNLAVASSLFIHLLPLGRFDTFIDLKPLARALPARCPPPGTFGSNFQFDVDGFIAMGGRPEKPSAYSQFFRFGGIEGYVGEIVRSQPDRTTTARPTLFATYLAGVINNYVTVALDTIRNLFQVDPPYVLMLSVEGVRGAFVPETDYYSGDHQIPQDVLRFQPLLLGDADHVAAQAALKPQLDLLWQAAGLPGAPGAER